MFLIVPHRFFHFKSTKLIKKKAPPINAKIDNHINDLSCVYTECGGLTNAVIKSFINKVKILKILEPSISEIAAFGFLK